MIFDKNGRILTERELLNSRINEISIDNERTKALDKRIKEITDNIIESDAYITAVKNIEQLFYDMSINIPYAYKDIPESIKANFDIIIKLYREEFYKNGYMDGKIKG